MKSQSQQSFLSPKANDTTNSPKRTVGFLPYWQLAEVNAEKLGHLSEIIYFGVYIDEEGNFVEKDSGGGLQAGLAKVRAGALEDVQKEAGTTTAISAALILHDNEKIEQFLKNDTAQSNFVAHTFSLIEERKLAGINLDFEYSGIPAKTTVDSFASFVSMVSQTLKEKYPALVVSVDITADAVKKSRLYDVERLGREVDYVILMGYDFYRPSSSVAGPVAPLTGKQIYEYDVTSAVIDFLSVVPKEKLVLGIPYYGWDFPTLDDSLGSLVEKRQDEQVALASYKRVRRLIEEEDVELRFDTDSQTPWLIYHDPDTNGVRQVWYEDKESLAKKYDFVKKEDLAGIAIWALGYDGEHEELWSLLKEKFGK